MSSTEDQMLRFMFDDTDIRGEVVKLDHTFQEVLSHNSLPAVVETLLGQFLAAASLLSSTLKFDGIITVQARGEGPLSLIMAECDHHKGLRGIAQTDENADFDSLAEANMTELLGKGVLAITIDPDQGQRYQGIVPLDADNLAGCLEHYFTQSEQLDTRFWIEAKDQKAAALMIQALPAQAQTDSEISRESWQTLCTLGDTVTAEELLELEQETLLYRLFHEQQVRLFEAVPVRFSCSCSRQRSADSLGSLGPVEVERLIAEQGHISVDCQFCNQQYMFGPEHMAELFGDDSPKVH